MTTATATTTAQDGLDYKRQDMMRRINALRAVAGDKASTPQEAASFAAAAQNLMIAYQITEQELVAAGKVKAEPYIKYSYNIGKRSNWRRLLMGAIAEANFCDNVWWSSNNSKYHFYNDGHEIFGQKSNIDICIYLYEYLAPVLERLADEALETARKTGKATHGKEFRYKFLMGAVNTISSRLQRADYSASGSKTTSDTSVASEGASRSSESVSAQDSASPVIDEDKHRALVVTKKDELKQEKKQAYRKIRSVNLYGNLNLGSSKARDAYHEGRAAGAKVPIFRGVKDCDELPRLEGRTV